MRLVDANVLLYAVDAGARHHPASRRWLDGALAGGEAVGFAWIVAVAFLRLSTSPVIFPSPLHVDEAVEQLDLWSSSPNAVWVQPGDGHLTRLRHSLGALGTGGNLVNDAHLAVLALEHRATVVSYDNDFGRFAGVRWSSPDDLLDPLDLT